VRYLVIFAFAIACDHKPAPRPEPAQPPPAPTQLADAGAAPQDPFADASLQLARIDVSPQCMEVGVRIADVMISTTTDPSQKAALEQDRAKLVRRTAETCSRDAWSDAARTCFLRATTQEQLQECGRNLRAP
jgi:hypothetical protein